MPVEANELPQVGQIERPLDVVDLALLEIEPVDQALAQVRLHPGRDLEPYDLAEAAAAELVLDGSDEVVGLVRDREVGVARDPERRAVQDLHAREELTEMARHDLLERDERPPVDRDETGNDLLRHLDAGEGLRRRLRVTEPDSEAQREIRDVGERPPRADRERRQRGEDLVVEDPVDLLQLGRAAPRARDDPNAVPVELGSNDVGPLP